MSPNLRAAASFLAAAVLCLCLGACEGSGCGEPPKEQAKAGGPGTSGAGSGGGGGQVAVGGQTEGALNAPLKEGAAKVQAASQPPAQARAGAVFAEIDSASYEPKILKAPGAVLVVAYTPKCRGWQDLQAALELFSQDMAGRIAVYRLNVVDPAQAKLLPSGMTALPVPGFAYYEGGQPLAQRQGMPFDRAVGKRGEPVEDPAEYQQRLRLWLREAMTNRSFQLPAPKRTP